MNINKADLCLKLLLDDTQPRFPGPLLSITTHPEKAVSNTQLVNDIALTILKEIALPQSACTETSILKLRNHLLLYCNKHNSSLDRNTSIKTATLLHLLIIKKFKESKTSYINTKWEEVRSPEDSATSKELLDALFVLFNDFISVPISRSETSTLPTNIFNYFIPLIDSLIKDCPADLIPQLEKDKIYLLQRIQLAEQKTALERELVKTPDIEKSDLSKRIHQLLEEKKRSKITEEDLLLLKDTSFSLDAEMQLICRIKQQLEIQLAACQVVQKLAPTHTTWSCHRTSKDKIYILPPCHTEIMAEVGLYIRTSAALEKLVNTGKTKTEAATHLVKDLLKYQKEAEDEKSKLFCDTLIDFYILNSKLVDYSQTSSEIERYFSSSLHSELTDKTSFSFPTIKRMQLLKLLWNATDITVHSLFYGSQRASNIPLQIQQLNLYLQLLLIIQKDAATKEQQMLFHKIHSRLVSLIKSPDIHRSIEKRNYYALTDSTITSVYDHIFSIVRLPVETSSYIATRAKLFATVTEIEKKKVKNDRENDFKFVAPKTGKRKKRNPVSRKAALEDAQTSLSKIKIDSLAAKTAALSVSKHKEVITPHQTKKSEITSVVKKSPLKLHPRAARWFTAKDSPFDPFLTDEVYIRLKERGISDQAEYWIRLEHNFASAVDYYAVNEGIQCSDIERLKTIGCNKQYQIPGEIIPAEGMGSKRKGIFTFSLNKDGYCYHRGFTEKKSEQICSEYTAKGHWNVDYFATPAETAIVTEKLKSASLDTYRDRSSAIETKSAVIINDKKNNATIILARLS